jgi:hypothetical protein
LTHTRPRNLLSTNKSIIASDRAPLRRARGGARGALARRSSSSRQCGSAQSRVLLERTHDSRGGTGDALSDSGKRNRSAGSVIGDTGANRCATGKIGVANGNIAYNACGGGGGGRGPLGGSQGLGEGGEGVGFGGIRDDGEVEGDDGGGSSWGLGDVWEASLRLRYTHTSQIKYVN